MKFQNKNMSKNENKTKRIMQFVIVFVFGAAISQSFAQYEINTHTINNGGGTPLSGGDFVLTSSIGQLDASNELANGNYQLKGGFWHENNDLIFKNDFE